MAATTLTTDGLLEGDISDIEICDTDELNEAEEKVLRERDTDFFENEDEIPCAQAPTTKETSDSSLMGKSNTRVELQYKMATRKKKANTTNT